MLNEDVCFKSAICSFFFLWVSEEDDSGHCLFRDKGLMEFSMCFKLV